MAPLPSTSLDVLSSLSRGSHSSSDGSLLSLQTQHEFYAHILSKLETFRQTYPGLLENYWPVRMEGGGKVEKEAWFVLTDLLLLLRKLREGIIATKRVDDFAIEVYEISATLAIQTANHAHITSTLSQLVPNLYLAHDCSLLPSSGNTSRLAPLLSSGPGARSSGPVGSEKVKAGEGKYIPPSRRATAASSDGGKGSTNGTSFSRHAPLQQPSSSSARSPSPSQRPLPLSQSQSATSKPPYRYPCPPSNTRTLFTTLHLLHQLTHHSSPQSYLALLSSIPPSFFLLHSSAHIPSDAVPLPPSAPSTRGTHSHPLAWTSSESESKPRRSTIHERIFRAWIADDPFSLLRLITATLSAPLSVLPSPMGSHMSNSLQIPPSLPDVSSLTITTVPALDPFPSSSSLPSSPSVHPLLPTLFYPLVPSLRQRAWVRLRTAYKSLGNTPPDLLFLERCLALSPPLPSSNERSTNSRKGQATETGRDKVKEGSEGEVRKGDEMMAGRLGREWLKDVGAVRVGGVVDEGAHMTGGRWEWK